MKPNHSIRDAENMAAKKVAIESWQAYRWEHIEGGSLITGCVPDGVYTRGPRKGRPRYSKPIAGTERRVIVSDTELDAAAVAYEAETGKCWDCKGTGQVFAGWHVERGTSTRACSRCTGTGNAPGTDGG